MGETPFDFASDLYVLAEIANAHNGQHDQLLALIDATAAAAADGVKFQWFHYDALATPDYSWYPVYRDLSFSEDQWVEALERTRQHGLDVWIDVSDEWALALAMTQQADIFGVKIHPSILLDSRLTSEILTLEKPTILGVGGHNDAVLDRQLAALQNYSQPIILIHGFQGYPTKPEDATLRRIGYLQARYGFPVGYADHEDGSSPLALRLPEYAYFAGAVLIEKHICLDRAAQGYDYYSSLEPDEFAQMVTNLRNCQVIMGGAEITEEQRNYLVAVASRAVLRQDVHEGVWLSLKDVAFRRTPDTAAMTPDVAEETLPAVATKSLSKGHVLRPEDCRSHQVVTIVPCRVKSSRLSQKAVRLIYDVPSIERCLLNTLAVKNSDLTVLATSTHPDDAVLKGYTLDGKVEFLRGSEDDVLERFLMAADRYHADVLLRVTGDCPVISYEIADLLIRSHLDAKADVTYCKGDFAVGTACEVYHVAALRRLRELVPQTNYSEYLLMYFTNNPGHFKLNPVSLPRMYRHPEWRLTLDEPADLELFELLFSSLQIGREPIAFQQIADYFATHPEAAQINSHIKLRYAHDEELVFRLRRVTKINKLSLSHDEAE